MHKPNYTNTRKVDTQWVFTLFGTAVGAGLLYLPVQAGDSGFLGACNCNDICSAYVILFP